MPQITDKDCYKAAVKQLKGHLNTRPATKAEVLAQIEALKAEREACLARAEEWSRTTTDQQGNSWHPDMEGAMRQKHQAGELQAEIDSLQAISDSPLHAYQQTTAALSARVDFYAKRAGLEG